MKKRILAIFLVMAALASLLCGCKGATEQAGVSGDETTASSGENQANNVITVGISQDLDNSLDPNLTTAAGTREVMFNVFEGLVKPDSEGNYVGAVASDYDISEDGLTYTFTLRDGVVFHDGSDCTADDVLYSFETCAATSVYATVVSALSAVEEIVAGDNNIIVKLSEANSDFLSVVSQVYIIPEDYTDHATAPIGTGPFRFVSRSVQENFVLEKHDAYYGEPAKLDKVTYKIYEDSNALFMALDSGALDLVAHLTNDQINSLSNGYDVLEGTMNLVQAIYLNHTVKPFDNVLVRQALCYAIDVDAMMDLTADGHGTKTGTSMYPNFGKYYEADLADAYPHDTEKAKELLKEAGYENGFTFTIKVPSNYEPHVNTAIVLADQLSAVGINAEIEQIDWNTWLTDVYSGREFEGTVVGFDASTLSATALLARWCSDSEKNMIGFKNADYDAAYKEAQITVDDAKQTELYKECLQILSDEAANVYLQDLADFVAINPNLEGFEFYPLYVMDMAKLYWAEN